MRHPRLLGEGSSFYHCMSRVVDGRFIFGDEEKRYFLRTMRGLERMTGIRILTYCLMSNHFHLLLRVPGPDEIPEAGEVSDDEMVRMVRALNGYEPARDLAMELRNCDAHGFAEKKAQLRKKFLDRRGRIDVFMKELKQRFSRWHNQRQGRRGTLWEERYKSVLVEGGEDPLLTMAAYIDLNPLRAGMVSDPADYPYSGYGEACAGRPIARRGLALVLEPDGANPAEVKAGRARLPSWREVGREYRRLLYGIGEERGPRDDGSPIRHGFSREEVATEMAGGGRVEPWKALRCRVRYFSDGAILGGKAFVEEVFEANRSRYGSRRETGARRMRGGDWGDLCVLRDLQLRLFE